MRKGTATFSLDRTHRWSLSRTWDQSKPAVAFCMLNPSVADHEKNDPTVERCQRRAVAMGFGKMIVVNLFSYVATDPNELYEAMDLDKVSNESNDRAIVEAANNSSMFICAWGKHGSLYGRDLEVMKILKDEGVEPYAFKINKDGSPAHPLYISYKVKPQMISLMVNKCV